MLLGWGLVLFIIISIIFSILLMTRICYEIYGENDEGAFISGLLSILLCISLVAGYVIIVSKIKNNLETEDYLDNTQQIYCLNDSSEISGRMYLYSGYIKENMVYRMYVDYNDGKKLKEVSADYSTIVEDNKTEIETYKTKYKKDLNTWLFGKYDKHETYKIHVPAKSITTDYNIDMK